MVEHHPAIGDSIDIGRRKGRAVEAHVLISQIVGDDDEDVGRARRGGLFVLRAVARRWRERAGDRSEEHTSELQSLMRISYAVFCLKKNTQTIRRIYHNIHARTNT